MNIQNVIKQVKSLGFQVYAPEKLSTYFYYIDGYNIAYMQLKDNGFYINTVHKPNRQTGTGFRMMDIYENEINKENLQKGFCLAPEWATIKDIKSVKKYTSIDEFLKWEEKFYGILEY